MQLTADQILGGVGARESAWPALRFTGALERLAVSAMACGLARAATSAAGGFIRERHQFGRPLKDFQSIQHAVVEAHTLTTGMQLYLENALPAHVGEDDAVQAISMAKYF